MRGIQTLFLWFCRLMHADRSIVLFIRVIVPPYLPLLEAVALNNRSDLIPQGQHTGIPQFMLDTELNSYGSPARMIHKNEIHHACRHSSCAPT